MPMQVLLAGRNSQGLCVAMRQGRLQGSRLLEVVVAMACCLAAICVVFNTRIVQGHGVWFAVAHALSLAAW